MHIKIINSSHGDEELLVPYVEDARDYNRIQYVSKAPSCGLCCNTKCGSYFISTLYVVICLLNLLTITFTGQYEDYSTPVTYVWWAVCLLLLLSGMISIM